MMERLELIGIVSKNSLYVDGVPFAEIADCDQNGKIEKADADLLITYYAQAAADRIGILD